MTFPATGGSREALTDVLVKIRQAAAGVRSYTQTVRDNSASGDIQIIAILNYMHEVERQKGIMSDLAATPGLAALAREQYNDAAFDIAAEFNAMIAALDDTTAWIAANAPKDAGGRWVTVVEIVNNQNVYRTLTPAQTAGLRTVLDALIATID